MGVAHFALDLPLGHHGRHGVKDHDVQRPGPHQSLGDFQGLLAGVRLGDQEVVDVHPQRPGISRVQGVLHVDEGGLAAPLLGLGHHLQGHGGLTGGFRPVDFHDAPLGYAAHAQGQVQCQGARGDHVHIQMGVLPQLHDGACAVSLFDLFNGRLKGLLFFLRGFNRHHRRHCF